MTDPEEPKPISAEPLATWLHHGAPMIDHWSFGLKEPVKVSYVTAADAVAAFLGSLTDEERESLRERAAEAARVSKADPERVFDALVTALATYAYSKPAAGD